MHKSPRFISCFIGSVAFGLALATNPAVAEELASIPLANSPAGAEADKTG